jgi:death-on-curing protein
MRATLELVQNDDYYRSIDAKLTHLVFSACKTHAFVEGNKRLALALGAKFINDNGFDNLVTKWLRFMENILVCVADNKIDKPFFGEIVTAFLNGDEDEEGMKLRVLEAIEL